MLHDRARRPLIFVCRLRAECFVSSGGSPTQITGHHHAACVFVREGWLSHRVRCSVRRLRLSLITKIGVPMMARRMMIGTMIHGPR